MKVTLIPESDPSVGIFANDITVDWPGLENWIDGGPLVAESERDDVRQALQAVVSRFLGEVPVGCRFEDECADCGARISDAKCVNGNCISNMPDERD